MHGIDTALLLTMNTTRYTLTQVRKNDCVHVDFIVRGDEVEVFTYASGFGSTSYTTSFEMDRAEARATWSSLLAKGFARDDARMLGV